MTRGHIQVKHQIGPRQLHLVKLKLVEPPEKALPLRSVELGRLMHRVGRGIPIAEHQPAGLIPLAPILPVGGKAIHRVKRGSRIGIHIAGRSPERPLQVQLDQGR